MMKNPNPNPNSPLNPTITPPQSLHSSTISSTSLTDIPTSPNSHSSIPNYPQIKTIFHLGFNQDYSCFVLGTDKGFLVYDCDPLKQQFKRLQNSTFSIVQMLFKCNLFVLVGSGTEPEYPKSKLFIWDDHENRYIGELSFRSEVKSVCLRRDRIVVVLVQKIHVYRFDDLKLLHQIETYMNDTGLCEVSQVSGNMVLVCLGLQKGQVRVEDYGLRKTKFIVAHDSRIACFALTNDGRLLATASSKGTLIRVFNTLDGSLLQEVRRGADRADIYSLAFSSTSQWLAVSSDKGTVHVFSLKIDSGSPGIERSNSAKSSLVTSAVSNLSFIKGVLPRYFSSEWSVAQFRLPEGCRYIVGFGHQENTVVIVGMDGSFFRCQFDPVTGGEMKQLEFHNVLKEHEQENV